MQVSAASGSMGGQDFWEALKRSTLEVEVKGLYADTKTALISKRGGPVLQVRPDAIVVCTRAHMHSGCSLTV